jgi:SAM-dependent methyltransferase
MQLRDLFFFVIGIGFLALSKAKNILKGYSSPKPFNMSEIPRCIDYDIHVFEHWLSHLKNYTGFTKPIIGKNVLELGPGSDLGVGICLLSKGCSQYNACDVNDLMKSTPDNFYKQLLKKLEKLDNQANITFLEEQLKKAKTNQPSRINYLVRKDFEFLSAFGESTIDLVFSQAAFEHFNDLESIISRLSLVCKTGGILVAEVDLKTHSRWIRDKDPNNIYRYPKWLYDLFWFRGIPNRLRPFQYKETLERFGWADVTITPIKKFNDYGNVYSGLNKAFSESKNQMEYLSIMICARKL